MHRTIQVLRGPNETFPPVGRCIYCASSDQPLETEHIFPDGLGGNLLLPKSTCRSCANRMHEFEMRVIKGQFGLVRFAMGLRSKNHRKEPRPTSYTTRDRVNQQKEVPVGKDMPHFMMTFDYHQRPTSLTGGDPRLAAPVITTSLKGMTRANGDWMTIPGPVKVEWYVQFLAKIAHAYAVASFGVDSFQPYLLDFLADPQEALAGHFIGMLPDKPDPVEGALHRLRAEVLDQMAYRLPLLPGSRRRLAVVYIDLFMNYWRHCTYEVVVGEML